jgi:hypothetical protein
MKLFSQCSYRHSGEDVLNEFVRGKAHSIGQRFSTLFDKIINESTTCTTVETKIKIITTINNKKWGKALPFYLYGCD